MKNEKLWKELMPVLSALNDCLDATMKSDDEMNSLDAYLNKRLLLARNTVNEIMGETID